MRKDGSLFWANVIVDPIRDDDGSLVGFAKITRDITERREAQLALRRRRRNAPRPRRWRRSASSPAASRTTSTTS